MLKMEKFGKSKIDDTEITEHMKANYSKLFQLKPKFKPDRLKKYNFTQIEHSHHIVSLKKRIQDIGSVIIT